MVMSVVLALIVVVLAILAIFQSIGSTADDVRHRPGMALARVALAFVTQAITVALAVMLGRGV